MSVSVQQRGARYQLRVKHKLLPRPFFFTFDGESQAREYGQQLRALLDRGIVPAELVEQPKVVEDPLLIELARGYVKHAPHITESDERLLGSMYKEMLGLRVGSMTYEWVERYISDLKTVNNLAPGTIRKRIGVLARVLDWHLMKTRSKEANPLRRLPVGYSSYTTGDKARLEKGRLEKGRPKVDVRRDRRLLPGEEVAIRKALAGDPDMLMLFDLLVGTGLRLREAYRLRVDQVDLAKGVLLVEGTKGPRGVLRPRVVPLQPGLRATLREWCAGRVGLLFPWWSGDLKQQQAATARLSYLFAKAFRDAGCDDLTAHDLRHEAACRWFGHKTGSGWTFADVEVARIMGWSSLAMAMRYASLRGEDLARRLG